MTKLEKYFDYRSNDRMLWCVIPEDRENCKVELVVCDSFRRLVMVFLGCWTRRSHWWSAWCIDRALLLMLWQILLALLSFHTRMCTHTYSYFCLLIYIYTYNLVGGFNPSQKYESQIGIIIPNIWKNKSNVPNHQPVITKIDIYSYDIYAYSTGGINHLNLPVISFLTFSGSIILYSQFFWCLVCKLNDWFAIQ